MPAPTAASHITAITAKDHATPDDLPDLARITSAGGLPHADGPAGGTHPHMLSTIAPQGTPSDPAQTALLRQIAIAMQGAGNRTRPVELVVEQAELGRVKLHLGGTDRHLHVVLSADRPETLELMRRHIDILARDIRDMGYQGAQFSFAGSDGGRGDARSFEPQTNMDATRPDGTDTGLAIDRRPSTAPMRIVLDDRIDIRL